MGDWIEAAAKKAALSSITGELRSNATRLNLSINNCLKEGLPLFDRFAHFGEIRRRDSRPSAIAAPKRPSIASELRDLLM